MMNTTGIQQIIDQRVAKALAAAETLGTMKSANQTGSVGWASTSQGCSYVNFMSYGPQTFKGTEGTLGLAKWIGNLESLFRDGNCAESNRVMYAACTLRDGALVWWNFFVQKVGNDAAYATPWETVKQMMTDEYCPRDRTQKLVVEFWNLRMEGTDVTGYSNRFLELAFLCPTMATTEDKEIEKYIGGLSPEIREFVISFKPRTIQIAINMAYYYTEQIVRQKTSVKQVEVKTRKGKRKEDERQERSFDKYPNKRPGVAKSHEEGSSTKRGYAGTHPYCGSCDRHHRGNCAVVSEECKKKGHLVRDCRVPTPKKDRISLVDCFKCGQTGHYRDKCPELKKEN